MDQLLQSAMNAINDSTEGVAPQHLGFLAGTTMEVDQGLANLTTRFAEP